MKAPALVALLYVGALAGCAQEPEESYEDWGECPTPEMSRFRIEAEGRPLRHAYLLAERFFETSLSCAGPEPRTDLPAPDGVAFGQAGRLAIGEIRLFFDDGTLRLGVELPAAPSHNLTVGLGSPPTMTDDGAPVPITRSEWLQGPEAGRDVRHSTGPSVLATRNETMALTVESAWNHGLFVEAHLYADPWLPEKPEPGGGGIRVTLLRPDGSVHTSQVAHDPDGYVTIRTDYEAEPGVWTVHFDSWASSREEPRQMLTTGAMLFY